MARQWRCAVVGVGVVGEWHVRVLPRVKNATLVVVCDLNAAKAQAALDKNKLAGIAVYTDEAEMLAKEGDNIDVVHICTPSGNHLDPAAMAMAAGKNVISEKPMEIHIDRIDRMIEAAEKHKVRLAGIFQNRWDEANRALHAAAQEGRFGRIAFGGSYTPWYRTDQYYADGGWRGTWALDGGGAIMNQSVHAVDLIQWIVGPVKTVSAYASSRIHPSIEVEDTLTCSLTFANGAHGIIMGSTAMYPGGGVRIEVGGEHGTAVSEGGLRRFKFRDERPEDKKLLTDHAPGLDEQWKSRIAAGLPAEQRDAIMQNLGLLAKASTGGGTSATDMGTELHRRNIQHILDAWDAGKEADTFGPEARKAVAIIEAMYASAKKQGEPVEVK